MSILSKRQSGQVVMIIDFGSGSVGGSLALFSAGQAPYILFSIRERILYREAAKSDPAKLLNLLSVTLEKVLGRLQKEGPQYLSFLAFKDKLPQKAMIVLASPWYQATSVQISVEEKNPVAITTEYLQRIVADNEKLFISKLSADPRTAYFFDNQLSILEHTIMETMLNGYPVDNPFGRHATHFSFTLYTSAASSAFMQEIRNKVTAFFHIPSEFHAFSLSALTALHKLHPEITSYVCLDITGAGTELMIVKKGVLVADGYVAFGRETITAIIKGQLGDTPPQVGLDLLKQHASAAPADVPPAVEKVFTEIRAEWQKALHQTLEAMPEAAFLPSQFFIAADHDIAPLAEVMLNNDPKFKSRIPLVGTPVISILDGASLEKLALFPGDTEPDPFVSIESCFAHELLRSSM